MTAADNKAVSATCDTPVRPVLSGFMGLAVLVVMLQSSGGFTVELLGPDLLITATGFAVTHSVLTGVSTARRSALWGWYREQLTLRAPLLIMTLGTVLAVASVGGRGAEVARTSANALAGLWPPSWTEPGPAGPIGRVDPLGPLWLIGLLVLFGLVWPSVLFALRRRLEAALLAPVVLGCAAAAWLIGPLRAASGADLAELALGGHVRLVEWLFGSAAGVAVVAMQASSSAESPTASWLVGHRSRPTAWAPALALLGVAILIPAAAVATWYPTEWLRAGGPGAAAFGTAAVLFALHGPGLGRAAAALGHGLPVELGRMAYPLLLLHSPLFWLIQIAVPAARPFALLVVGGALSWVLGLLLQDGLVRRWRARRTGIPRGIGVMVLAVLVAGVTIGLSGSISRATVPGADPGPPVVLVLGGTTAGELAAALARSGTRFTVVDASRPGCGLLAEAPATGPQARTTAAAQAPTAATNCGDWPQAWRDRIAAVRPAVVVVDLSADAAARTSSAAPVACESTFRLRYRELMGQAVGVWTAGAPGRPVLLTTARDNGMDGSVRCLNALVGESAGTYRELSRLDVDEQLCPNGTCRTHTLDGEPLLDGTRLTGAGLAELGIWLDLSIAGRADIGP